MELKWIEAVSHNDIPPQQLDVHHDSRPSPCVVAWLGSKHCMTYVQLSHNEFAALCLQVAVKA